MVCPGCIAAALASQLPALAAAVGGATAVKVAHNASQRPAARPAKHVQQSKKQIVGRKQQQQR